MRFGKSTIEFDIKPASKLVNTFEKVVGKLFWHPTCRSSIMDPQL